MFDDPHDEFKLCQLQVRGIDLDCVLRWPALRRRGAHAASCQRWHKIAAMVDVRGRPSAEAVEAPRLLFDCLIWPKCP